MRLLLDTNIMIVLSERGGSLLRADMLGAIESENSTCFVSIVSLWEIAIKWRLGKLESRLSADKVAQYFDRVGLQQLSITREQVLAELESEPQTRDPFDRLLLAVCKVEGLRLVTRDRLLAQHPLAWR